MKANQIQRAFSLTEILVVIGILALLIGILIPSLSIGREASHRVVSANNLRNIGVALQVYRDEHQGMLPTCQTFPIDPPQAFPPTIMEALEPYDLTNEIWHNPSDSVNFQQYGTSYEYMIGFPLMAMPTDDAKRKMINEMASLPRSFVIVDADGYHPGGPNGADRQGLIMKGGEWRVDWFHEEDQSN